MNTLELNGVHKIMMLLFNILNKIIKEIGVININD